MISANCLSRLTLLTVFAIFCVTSGAAQDNANKGQSTGLVKQIDQGRLQQTGVRPSMTPRAQPFQSLIKQHALISNPRNLAMDFDRPGPNPGKSLPAPAALSTSQLLSNKSSKPSIPGQGVNPSNVKVHNAKQPDASKVQ